MRGIVTGAAVLCALLVMGPSPAAARDIYVSPTGSDSADGGPQTPVASLGKAKAMVRALLSTATLSEDIHVKLADGVYFIDGPLIFTNEDSGTTRTRIFYESLPGAQPRIVGGLTTKLNWQRYAGGNIWVAAINPYSYLAAYDRYGQRVANPVFRDLYVNRVPAVRARFPKSTYLSTLVWNTGEKFPLIKQKDAPNLADAVAKRGADCSNMSKRHPVEFISQQQWTQSALRIGAVANGMYGGNPSLSLYLCPAEKSALQQGDGAETKLAESPYHLENSLDFLTEGNEWYFDAEASKLYYQPAGGADPNAMEFMIPTLETLIRITGRSASQPVMNLTFSGLTFENTTFYDPAAYGYVNQQASMYRRGDTYMRQPAAVSASNVQGLVFTDNIFMNLGAEGLQLMDSSRNDLIETNAFHDIGGSCLSLGGGDRGDQSSTGTPLSLRMSDHDVVRKNRIWSCGTRYAGSVGIFAMYAKSLTVTRNDLRYLPYTGISVGWGWDNGDVGMSANAITDNHIFDFMRLLYDGGGIYTQGSQRGSEISNNRIGLMLTSGLYCGFPPAGIYLDQGSNHFIVRGNLMRKIMTLDNQTSSMIKLNVGNTPLDNWVVDNRATNLNTNWFGADKEKSWADTSNWETINPSVPPKPPAPCTKL
jgi:hypothetical protein